MEKEDFDFESAYDEIRDKYSLPEFKRISEDFDIEKISDKKPNFLTRDVRKAINEKIIAYLQLIETLINPNTPPMFVFSILRNISEEDKNSMKDIYKKLSAMQIKVMKLDTIYNEEKEAKFINEIFNMWQDLKLEIYKIMSNFKSSDNDNDTLTKTSYFG